MCSRSLSAYWNLRPPALWTKILETFKFLISFSVSPRKCLWEAEVEQRAQGHHGLVLSPSFPVCMAGLRPSPDGKSLRMEIMFYNPENQGTLNKCSWNEGIYDRETPPLLPNLSSLHLFFLLLLLSPLALGTEHKRFERQLIFKGRKSS